MPFGGLDLCHTEGDAVHITLMVCKLALVHILQDAVGNIRESAKKEGLALSHQSQSMIGKSLVVRTCCKSSRLISDWGDSPSE